jgi:hypothetical protein
VKKDTLDSFFTLKLKVLLNIFVSGKKNLLYRELPMQRETDSGYALALPVCEAVIFFVAPKSSE